MILSVQLSRDLGNEVRIVTGVNGLSLFPEITFLFGRYNIYTITSSSTANVIGWVAWLGNRMRWSEIGKGDLR